MTQPELDRDAQATPTLVEDIEDTMRGIKDHEGSDTTAGEVRSLIAALTAATARAEEAVNEIARKQYDWVERMGWHNKTVLEALALIASEVGEAVNECRGEKPTENFGAELADIILRTLDLAHWQGIDVAESIRDKMKRNEENKTRGRRV